MRTLNDNESFSKKNLNDNDNEGPFVVGRKPGEISAYRTAMTLAEKFNNPKGLRFYYDVALKLTESDIWQMYETATTKKGLTSPGKYFTTMCNNSLARSKT
jgi:hypothetical protein